MYKILSVSRNTRLLLQRNDTVALAGFRVISPRTPEQAPYLAFEQMVDAVIIGHSVEPGMRQTIIEMLRRLCPELLIIFVYLGAKQEEAMADISLDPSDGLQPLIEALQEKLPGNAAAD